MEYLVIHIFMVLGIFATMFYSYMAFVIRSPEFPIPSKLVIFGLGLLAVIGALIRISQFSGEKFGLGHYLKVFYVAIALPGFAAGFAIFRVLLIQGTSYFTKK